MIQDKIQQKTDELQKNIDELQKKIDELQKQIDELQKQKEELQKIQDFNKSKDYQPIKFQLLNLEDGDLFRILRFITFLKRENVASRNRRLNYIAFDNNKNLLFKNDNQITLMKLVNKIRCFNQFQDFIKITLTRYFKIEDFGQFFEQTSKKLEDLRELEINQKQ